MRQSEFLSRLDRDAVTAAIGRAEGKSSAEVRVHIQPKTFGRNAQEVAARTFERLGMTKTALRNGVLLFIASEEQSFAIIGDRGIHEKVGDDFWNEVAAKLTERFKAGELTVGIVEALDRVGELLGEHFPRAADDVNELLDEISIGEDEEESRR